ncbi:uroporphyrinogen decarboxylase [Candidatus Marinamargulisbacteria bacterium SCGC AG-410-N11]|nr:uroporphyrinogen decarboxylase [Candidatus Marinamargulisbacteria bacterium SCGC AG-410-N11]
MNIYLQATQHKTLTRPPIWMMRQAGRYLPEYQKIRQKHSFLEMIRTPDIATEITLQPITRFGMDAAILFCDILVTAELLGSQLEFVEKKGPIIDNPIRSESDIQQIPKHNTSDYLNYVTQAIQQLKQELPSHVPLLGFAGAPFTVASYMIEGKSAPQLPTIKQLIGKNPTVLTQLLDKLTEVTIDYLGMQIDAGVDSIQLFDTWAGELSWLDVQEYSLNPIKKITTALKQKYPTTPITLFTKQTSRIVPFVPSLNIDILSVDWQSSLPFIRQNIPSNIGLQGNLDPQLLSADVNVLKERVHTILNDMAPYNGYIFNLGHGILPTTPFDNVHRVVDWVKQFSKN